MYDAPLTVPTLLLTLVLVVSGVAKLANRETAADAFVSLRLPAFLTRMRAPQLLPFAELVLAAALLVTSGPLAVATAVVALGLFLAYLAVIVRALGFDEPVTCSCFGALGLGSVDRFTAVRNVILVALAGFTLFDATRGRSVASRVVDFTGAEWAWLAGVFAALLLTWLIAGRHDATRAASAAPLEDDQEYLRIPIPFATLRTPDDAVVTLRDLARAEAVLLVFVSPTCGSCTSVIERARGWQHDVDGVSTRVVLAAEPSAEGAGLHGHQDFDLLYDPGHAVGRLFGVNTPAAVLLGADGKLAGGPVTGGPAVLALLDDIAAQLGQASGLGSVHGDDSPTAPTTTKTPDRVEAVPTVETHANAEDSSAGAEQDLLDYVPVPTPFAAFEDAEGTSTSLRQIGAAGPGVLLFVSPGCGPCVRTMDAAPGWQERLGTIPVYYVVTTQPQAEAVVARDVPANRVLVDEPLALAHMMGLSTPSMFAVGPTQELLAGPVKGEAAVAEAMEEIIIEVTQARAE